MNDRIYLNTLRIANNLIKLSTILTIAGLIAIKAGLLNDNLASGNVVSKSSNQKHEMQFQRK